MPVLEKVPGIQFSGGTKVLRIRGGSRPVPTSQARVFIPPRTTASSMQNANKSPSLAGYQIASACYFKKLLILLRENCYMSLHFIVRD